jgi:hypothetical protein
MGRSMGNGNLLGGVFLVIALALAPLVGCSDDEPGDTASDAGVTADSSEDEDAQPDVGGDDAHEDATSDAASDAADPDAGSIPDDAIELQPHPALGGEWASGVADQDGSIAFYSPEHGAAIALELGDQAGDSAGGLQVAVWLDEDRGGHFVVSDPDGEYLPTFFELDVPFDNAEVDVSSDGLGESVVTFDESDPSDPFAGQLTAVTLLVRVAVTQIAVGMVASALGNFAQGLCERAGFRLNVCSWVNSATSFFVGGAGFKAFKLVSTASWKAGAEMAAHLAITEGINLACSEAADFLGDGLDQTMNLLPVRWAQPTDSDSLGWYKSVLGKLNYLLWKLETDPPDDAAALESTLEADLPYIIKAGDLFLPDRVELYSHDLANTAGQTTLTILAKWAGPLYLAYRDGDLDGQGIDSLLDLGKESWDAIAGEYDLEDWKFKPKAPKPSSTFWTRSRNKAIGAVIGCGVMLVGELSFKTANGLWGESFQVLDLVEDIMTMWEKRLDDLYWEYYQEELTGPACEVDLHEPNETWERAAQSPIGAPAGTTIEEDLTLCGPNDDAVEDDWYAFEVGRLNMQVTVEAFQEDGDAGSDMEVCMEAQYRDWMYDLGGLGGPSHLAGPTCGKLGDNSLILNFGVSQTTGSTGDPSEFNHVYIHIYPADSGAAGDPVDYRLRFTR